MFWYFVLYFAVFSFVGWVSETLICSIQNRKYVKRGFLSGPFIPVYGFGGLMVVYILAPFKENILLLYCVGVVATTLLEYCTAVLMEGIFNVKLWDYSQHKYSLHGRIWLISSLFFGLLSILAVYVIFPPFERFVLMIKPSHVPFIAGAFLLYFIADTTSSTFTLLQINGKLAELEKIMAEAREKIKASEWDPLSLGQRSEALQEKYAGYSQEIRENLEALSQRIRTRSMTNWMHRRMLDAFPTMRSRKYNDQLKHLRQSIEELRDARRLEKEEKKAIRKKDATVTK